MLASKDGNTFEEVFSYPDTSGVSAGDIDTIHLNDVNAKYLKVVMTERKAVNGTKYGYSLYELEAYSKTELAGAEKLLEEAEKLLNEPTKGAKANKERIELIAAKDELESYLGSNHEFDGFTFHVLVRTLETKMDSYKNRL